MEALFSIIEWFFLIMIGIVLGLAWHMIELIMTRRLYEREHEYQAHEQKSCKKRGWMLCSHGRKGELKLRRS